MAAEHRLRQARALGTVAVCLIAAPLSAQSDEGVLLELHQRLVRTQMLDRDPTFLLANSVDAYTVVAPGGVVETREQVIAGLTAFTAIDSVTLSRERVVLSGATAVVLSRQVVHGEIRGPAAGFGPVSTITVFTRTDSGRWLAVSRAITPCHPRAIEAGRC